VAKPGDDAGHRFGGRGHDREARHERQRFDIVGAGLAQDGVAAWIDEADLALKAAAQEVLGNVQSDRTLALARSHKGKTGRLEQEIEVPDRHGALRWLRLGCSASASRPQRRDLISYF